MPDKSTDLKEAWREHREWHSWKEAFIFEFARLSKAVERDVASLLVAEGGAP